MNAFPPDDFLARFRANVSALDFFPEIELSSRLQAMGVRTFIKESIITASPESVFAFHELPDALQRLTPPWESARVVQAAPDIHVGSKAIVETRIFGFLPVRWVAEHTAYDPPHMFEDVQVQGPFRRWRHRHMIQPHPAGAVLRDEIEYEPPLGLIGQLVAPFVIVPRLERVFEYRHCVTREWCESVRMVDPSQSH